MQKIWKIYNKYYFLLFEKLFAPKSLQQIFSGLPKYSGLKVIGRSNFIEAKGIHGQNKINKGLVWWFVCLFFNCGALALLLNLKHVGDVVAPL